MAKIPDPLNEEELKSITTVGNMKKEYVKITEFYKKLKNGDFNKCPKCGEWLATDTSFYSHKDYSDGRYPICKRCILAMVEQRSNKTDTPNETIESVQKVCQMMDLPYIDSFYRDCIKGAEDGVKEKNRKSPWGTYVTAILSLPNWRGLNWAQSEFGDSLKDSSEEIRIVQKTIKNGKKRFGPGYSDSDYQFLENEYSDWVGRYECSQKSQEEVFESLSILKLQKTNALKAGKPIKEIKEIDTLIQSWLDTGNLKPKQNTMDTFSDAQTLGTLLQKYEETRPLPEIDPELQDVDKIGTYIDAFYRGHASKMLGIKNTFVDIYERIMSKYTVKPPEYDDESDSEVMFEKIFGSRDDE